MARLWHTAILTGWKPIFEYIPLESQIEKFQDEYYAAIAACHVEGSSNRFVEFMLQQIDAILDEAIVQFSSNDEVLSEQVKKLLAVMEYDVPYTMDSLIAAVGLQSKSSFRKHYLQPAMQFGLISMTLPDKPKSKNQRYVKK